MRTLWMKRSGRAMLATAAAVAVMAGVAAPVSEGSHLGPTVGVRDDFFSPKRITVPVGGKVLWVWVGQDSHNVTFRRVPRGASKRRARTRVAGHFSRTFSKAGRYRYVCTIHEDLGMKGTVVAK